MEDRSTGIRMNQDKLAVKDEARREIMTHLSTLQDRCGELLAARDPFSVYNEVGGLRSLVGQIDSAAQRYRRLA
jgi:hypothetical protein